MVDIKGLDKARVLKALYDHSHIQGLGMLQAAPERFVTVEHCARLLTKHTSFDYLYGRVLKVDLSGDEFDERLYDRDCGDGAAQRAVDSIKGVQRSSENAAENMEDGKAEKDKQVDDTVKKAMGVLMGVPPEISIKASMVLVGVLTNALATKAMLSTILKPTSCPPMPPSFMRFDIRVGEKKERDIVPPPFPWDLSSMSRQG